MSAATIIEHRGHSVELAKHLDTGAPERDGWYVTHERVGTDHLGQFQTNSAAIQAARLWIDQKIREGKL